MLVQGPVSQGKPEDQGCGAMQVVEATEGRQRPRSAGSEVIIAEAPPPHILPRALSRPTLPPLALPPPLVFDNAAAPHLLQSADRLLHPTGVVPEPAG